MKKKHKKANTDENMDFPGREEIKFGEVVEAPPKLFVPKAFKNNAHKITHMMLLKKDFDCKQLRPIGSGKDGHQDSGFRFLHSS
ncbi:hypothetical protein RND71_026254 [Anisodus tanguticus]|uniref:Uncharacterized protein n=1 Tax=Anisodus tanguticus TaxID=243964 RepID=A0AAE1RM22_9SOLA|nr:hypothetical protein RND71_026254 [Anisodus tanguticus]